MRKALSVLSVLIMLLLTYSASLAQSETVFSDTLTTISGAGMVQSGFGEGKYIYLSGSSYGEEHTIATVTKMDTSGKVIWTAADYQDMNGYEASIPWNNRCKKTIKIGTELYSIASQYNSVYKNQLWCLSDSSGALLWKTSFADNLAKVVDYSPTELIAVSNSAILKYYLVDKATGKVLFTKAFGNYSSRNAPNVLVDKQKNIVLSWSDTCRKFRDKHLANVLWTSNIPYDGRFYPVDVALQDSGRYILLGRNFARAVDSLTGATIWKKTINVGYITGVQWGGDGDPQDYLIKDSLVYVTWTSPVVGSVDLTRGFVLTRLNTRNGYMKFNVAHNFTNVPTPGNRIDWPQAITVDDNRDIYMTGSYDGGNYAEGDWGIMKMSGETGDKKFEATITQTPAERMRWSYGSVLYSYNNKIFCVGNTQKSYDEFATTPYLVSFDTTSIYHETARVNPQYNFRYPSTLQGGEGFGSNKIALLKQVGRTGIVEVRDVANQLLWKQTFNRAGRFTEPQMIKTLSDTAIAACFVLRSENQVYKMVPAKADSLIFVRINAAGNVTFRHSIVLAAADSFRPDHIYTDIKGTVNFVYTIQPTGSYWHHYAYTLGTNFPALSGTGNTLDKDFMIPGMRMEHMKYFRGDSTIFFYAYVNQPASAYINVSRQIPDYYTFGSYRKTPDFKVINSALQIDSMKYFLMGTGLTGKMLSAVYDFKSATPELLAVANSNSGTMLNGDTSANAYYVVSRKADLSLYVSRQDRTNGTERWSLQRSPQLRGAIFPIDFKYNTQKEQLVIGGMITDTTDFNINRSLFTLTIDSSGAVVSDIVQPVTAVGENRVTAVDALGNGSNFYGGGTGSVLQGPSGFYNIGCPVTAAAPAVSISAPSLNTCPNAPITFKALPVNAGTIVHYQWKLNGANVGADQATFTLAAPVNNDIVKVVLTTTNTCAGNASAESAPLTVTVVTQAIPAAVITTSAITICAGANATFTATVTNGGQAPFYQWKKNGHNVGTNNAVYTDAALENNDVISLKAVSSLPCASPDSVVSNVITMQVVPVSATLTISGNTALPAGGTTTIAATISGISNAVYTWMDSTQLHGWATIAGAMQPTIAYAPLNASDQVRCVVTGETSCSNAYRIVSNTLVFSVTGRMANVNNFVIFPNPVNDILRIDSLNADAGWALVTIVSSAGLQTYQAANLAGNSKLEIDVSNYTPGLYFVMLRKRDGTVRSKRFIKN